jgi:hypothetical protein
MTLGSLGGTGSDRFSDKVVGGGVCKAYSSGKTSAPPCRTKAGLLMQIVTQDPAQISRQNAMHVRQRKCNLG